MVEDVLKLAEEQLGNNGDIYIKWWNDYHKETGPILPYSAYWCAVFVSWLLWKIGDKTVEPFKGCSTGVELFKAKGRFHGRSTGYMPKPRDIIFYEWKPEDEGTDYDDGSDHVGIVTAVRDGRVYTIEGNNNNLVRRDWWSVWAPEIEGYATPFYEEDEEMSYEKFCEYLQRWQKEQAEKPVSAWAKNAVQYCEQAGYMVGDGSKFRPQSAVTRQELAKVVQNITKAGE